MAVFRIGERYIEAKEKASAEEISKLLEGVQADRGLIIKLNGKLHFFEVGDEPTTFYTLEKNSVTYCGEAKKDSGSQILDAAVASFDSSKKQAAKIASLTKTENRKRNAELDKANIGVFESTIPTNARALYESTMQLITGNAEAYKIEIIEKLTGVFIDQSHWLTILTWFRDKVLENEEGKKALLEKSLYQLRASFVTTVKSIVTSGSRSASTMKGVASDGRSQIDWLEYAKKNKS